MRDPDGSGALDGAQRATIYQARALPECTHSSSPGSRARAIRFICTCTSGRAKRWRSADCKSKVLSAKLYASGKPVEFEQEQFRVQFKGLPKHAPDDPVTVLAIECDSEPVQDTSAVRRERPRLNA